MSELGEKDARQYIAVGAVWRRKKTGALVRIVALKNHASSWNPNPYYDISWETVEKPVRRGASYEDYWLKNCEPVTRPTPPGSTTGQTHQLDATEQREMR